MLAINHSPFCCCHSLGLLQWDPSRPFYPDNPCLCDGGTFTTLSHQDRLLTLTTTQNWHLYSFKRLRKHKMWKAQGTCVITLKGWWSRQGLKQGCRKGWMVMRWESLTCCFKWAFLLVNGTSGGCRICHAFDMELHCVIDVPIPWAQSWKLGNWDFLAVYDHQWNNRLLNSLQEIQISDQILQYPSLHIWSESLPQGISFAKHLPLAKSICWGDLHIALQQDICSNRKHHDAEKSSSICNYSLNCKAIT